MHDDERVNPCPEIVDDYTGAFGKLLQTADRKGFQNIEGTKQYKAGKKRFPSEGDRNESNELSGDLVDDDELRIFAAGSTGDAGGGGDADKSDDGGRDDCRPGALRERNLRSRCSPQEDGGDGSPSAGTGLDASDAEEGGGEGGPDG